MKKLIAVLLSLIIIATLATPYTSFAEESTPDSNVSAPADDPSDPSQPSDPTIPEEPEEPTTIPAKSVKLNAQTLNLTLNETKKITASVLPAGATYSGKFSSENNSIASIDQNGNVTARKRGFTYVYYKTDNGLSARCKVVIENTTLPLKLNKSSVRLIYDKKLKKGTTFQLKYTKNAKSFFKVVYSSGDKKIAEVSASGVITPKGAGKTVITVNADGAVKKCTVQVLATNNQHMSLNEKANRAALKKSSCTRYVYGTTVQGRDLEAYIIKGSKSKKSKILFIDFSCHGFEDSYARDGKVLVSLGNEMVDYYANHPGKLKDYTLVVVPCANPDGTIAGKNNLRACKKAFGRCTAAHVDMNRDFGAFKGKESRALRDLFKIYKPKVYLNFHGWLNTSIGTPWLARLSSKTLSLNRVQAGSYGKGYISTYVRKKHGAAVCLVEYKSPKSARKSATKTKKFINAIVNR